MSALPRSTPYAEGVDSRGIDAFVRSLEEADLETHSYLLVRHGKTIAEGWWRPYEPSEPHLLYSLSKSYCSTAAGFAVAEGLFSLDDTVVSFFPDDVPSEQSPHLAAMKVRHLLSMSTGNAEEASRLGENWVRAFQAQPVPYEPGTHFLYNSLATYMVSAIVQKTSGQRVVDYLRPRFWEPLGIEEASWETCPRGIDTGGWGLSLTTESIAKLGLLYLRDGIWDGRRILPDGWAGEATQKHISNGDDPNSDWAQGYGFQFWRCRHGAYRGDGAFGQFCIVMPEQDAVLAVTGGGGDMQATLNQVWQHLLPAMEGSGRVLPGPTPAASAGPYSGQYEGEGRTYTFSFGGESAQVGWDDETLCVGSDWTAGTLKMGARERRSVASRGAWTDPQTYEFKVVDLHSPASLAAVCRFTDTQVEVAIQAKGIFGPDSLPTFVGRKR